MAGILELKRQRSDAQKVMEALVAAAEGENRNLTVEEREKLVGLRASKAALQERIEILQEIETAKAEMSRSMVDPIRPDVRPAGPGNGPFASFGEQLRAVHQAAMNPGSIDPRLMALTGAGESGSSGEGFLVQQEFTTEILGRMYGTGQIMSRVRRREIGANANGLRINVLKEISRATGSRFGGIRMYWTAEGGTISGSKPAYRRFSLDLEKVAGPAVPTDELLQDATGLQGEVTDAFSQELAFVCEDGVYRGDGAGKPLGLLSSPALATVDKETGQAAATIVEDNLVKMWSRLWAPSRTNAVWLINQECETQLNVLARPVGAGALPSQIVRYSPDGSVMLIFGKPVIPVEYASALGTKGDIVLTDLGEYRWIDKGGVQQASSIHLYFTTDELAFRFIYRCNGAPFWESALTPYKGGSDLSSIVTLAARA